MSIYGAMFSGVSGLNANSQALGAIADNITNVNTIGYKATEVRFQTLVTAQAGLNNYSPGGVQQRPFANIDVQGLFQSSTNSTDLGISGEGFFVINENSQHDGATGFRFSRAGAFNADKNGYLRNTAGFYLQGYRTNAMGQTVDSDGVEFNPDPTVFTNLETIRLNNIGGTADATENLTFGANLDATADVGETGNTTIQVYDSLGVAHNLELIWTKVANNEWDLSVSPPTNSAAAVMADTDGQIYSSVGRLDLEDDAPPADGDTIVVNGVTYEFDNNAAVTGGNTLVDIGAAPGNAETAIDNLATELNWADLGLSGIPADTNTVTVGGTVFEFNSVGGVTAPNVAVTVGTLAVTKANLFAAIQTAGLSSSLRFAANGSDSSRLDIRQTELGQTDITFNATGTTAFRQSGAGTTTGGTVTLDALEIDPDLAGVSFDGTTGTPSNFNVDQIRVDLSNGAGEVDINFDFGSVDQPDGLVQFAEAYNPQFIDTDGAAFGQFSGVTISETGLVTALFENGDIRPIFQIPVATFPNPNGLGSNTGNVYNQTDFSGLFFLRTPTSGGAGSVQSNVLESSTVDIAKEFTNMITTQRAYSASAKIISTADEMLDELVRIKR